MGFHERVLVHGALGGLASAFPGVARTLGNASGDWQHTVATDSLWLGSLAIAGFSSGYYFPAHPGKSGPPPRAPSTPSRKGWWTSGPRSSRWPKPPRRTAAQRTARSAAGSC